MTGIIESIHENGGYQGNARRWGRIAEVQEYLKSIEEDQPDTEEFSLEQLEEAAEEQEEGAEKAKEGRDRGPSSHSVTVRFGEDDASFTISFQSLAEVASLMIAYVVTCHKMQGGEAPMVMWICHQSHKRPLNREWGYTAQTRGSQRVVMFYTRQGLGFMLTKQNIKGATLQAKVASFQALQKVGIAGASVKVRLPKSNSKGSLKFGKSLTVLPAERSVAAGNTAKPVVEERVTPQAEPQPTIHIHLHAAPNRETPVTRPIVDGGALRAMREAAIQKAARYIDNKPAPKALPAPQGIPQHGAVRAMLMIEDAQRIPRLTYQPLPAAPKVKAPVGLAALMKLQKERNK